MRSRRSSQVLSCSPVAWIVGVLLLVLAPSGASGSIGIQEHLATVEEVRVKMVSGIYEDAPGGLESAEFEKRMQDSVVGELTSCGVPLADSSDQKLLVLLHQSTPSSRAPDVLVFSVIVELTESAVLQRSLTPSAESGEVRVTTWNKRRLVTTTPETALEDLREAVRFAAHSFALEVSVAKHRYEGREMPDCFAE